MGLARKHRFNTTKNFMLMKHSILKICSTGLLLTSCNVAFAQQTIEFNSLSSDSSFHAIYKGTATYTDKVNGVFTRPSGVVGNVPVMVIMHGSGGVSEGGTGQWNDYFLKRGIATFVIDSFTPRGIKSTVADHSLLYAGGSVADDASDKVQQGSGTKLQCGMPRIDTH